MTSANRSLSGITARRGAGAYVSGGTVWVWSFGANFNYKNWMASRPYVNT